MDQELNLEGERYNRRFCAELRTSECWGGGEYTEYKYNGYRYEGAGIIEDKSNGEKYFFMLRTNNFKPHYDNFNEEKDYNLEESIVYFNQKEPFYAGDFRLRPIEGAYEKIIDLSLENIVSQVKASKKDIPMVSPIMLRSDELIRLGLCPDRHGQLYIPLSV